MALDFTLPSIHDNEDGSWGPSTSSLPVHFKEYVRYALVAHTQHPCSARLACCEKRRIAAVGLVRA
jgi:hypothetical protein